MGLLKKLIGKDRGRKHTGKPVLPDADADAYLRQIQSDEVAERAMARLHLPDAFVFSDDLRLSGGDDAGDESIRKRQAVFYELGRLCARHPRFDTCQNLHAMLSQGFPCPDVLYDASGQAPEARWVLDAGGIALEFTETDSPRAVYTGEPTDDMVLDMESAAASSLRQKVSHVLEKLGAGAYETELPAAIWEMSGRSIDKMTIYRLVMDDAPEGDDPERSRLVFYGRELEEVSGLSRDLGVLAELDRFASAWLDLEGDFSKREEVPLYNVMLQEMYRRADIDGRVRRREAGEPWEDIWTGITPDAESLAKWEL